MWLINIRTLELESFQECPADTYAILSHTWGSDAEELNFDEFKTGKGRQKIGFRKIELCCEQANQDGLQYAWVDTCCIDKRSSTELSEAINSMFEWYAQSKICYVYLEDVFYESSSIVQVTPQNFAHSRWFTRGWTLQELIAPLAVSFYTRDWTYIGDKLALVQHLQAITGIAGAVFTSQTSFLDCSVAQRMSWAAKRRTTRIEDTAYCLIGLFKINLPLLYGEGPKAFLRLQDQIIQQTADETIFAWSGVSKTGSGLLASSPANFIDSTNIIQAQYCPERPPYRKTNRGLEIQCQMLPCEMNTYVVPLQCELKKEDSNSTQVVIFICRTLQDHQYRRVTFRNKCIDEVGEWEISKAKTETISVPDDGRAVTIMPRGGLPHLHILSTLQVWRHPWSNHVSQVSSQYTLDTTMVEDVAAGAISLKEVYDTDSNSPTDTPHRNNQVSFQPQANRLERGIVLVFKRLASKELNFHYYLKVGFDADFRPACILYTCPFRLMENLPYHEWLGISINGLQTVHQRGPSKIPVFESFWADDFGKISSHTTQQPMSDYYKSHRVSSVIPQSAPFIEPSLPWPMPMYSLPMLRYIMPGFKDQHWWEAMGDRTKGFELHINDELPSIYGCTNLKLIFKHLDGLDWQLTLNEEPMHPGSLRSQRSCRRRRLVRAQRLFMFFSMSIPRLKVWLIFPSIFVALSYEICGKLQDILNITNTDAVKIYTGIVTAQIALILCIMLLYLLYYYYPVDIPSLCGRKKHQYHDDASETVVSI